MAIGPESQVLGLSRSQLYRLVGAHTLDGEPADHGSLRNGHLQEALIFLSEYAFSDEKTQPSRRSVRPPTRKRHLLVGVRVLRRENAIFSSKRAFSGEKTLPSRRSTRPPTRKRNLLFGARILRRENAIFLSECASFDDKMQSSRRSARPFDEKLQSSCRSAHSPTRKRDLLVGSRVLRGEDVIF